MFTLGRKRLKIVEKDRASVVMPNVHLKDAQNPNNGELNFSAIKLHIAIARCILSKDLTNIDLVFEAISSYFRYQTIINTSNHDLTLNQVNFELLRDFSQKTRIGELAQGIIYLLSQEHLKYPIVVDFEGFVKNKNPSAQLVGKTPDFIIQKEANLNYSIIESKGHYTSSNSSTKGKLRRALEQCDNGKKIIDSEVGRYSLNKSYGTCVKFYNENNTNVSEIQFVDPASNESNDNFNIDIIRYHYASWFLLMGNMEIYEKLIGQKFISNEDLGRSNKKKINGISYQMYDLHSSRFLLNYNLIMYLHPRSIFRNYGIRTDVLEVLMGKSTEFPEIRIMDPIKGARIKYEIFSDGTIISST